MEGTHKSTRPSPNWPAPLGVRQPAPSGSPTPPGGTQPAGEKEPPPPPPSFWQKLWPDVVGGSRTLFNTALCIAVFSFCMAQFAPNNELTPAALDKQLQSTSSRVLLYFWQPDCPGCERMKPMVDELERAARDVKVIRINALASSAVAAQYEIRGTPTFVAVRRGQIVGRNDGPFEHRFEFVDFSGSKQLR